MHQPIVFSVAFICLAVIELRVIKTVMSTALVLYKMLPTICWTHWHLLHQDVVMNWGGGGPVPRCPIVLVQVSTDTFVTFWAWHFRIIAVSFWCSLSSRCQPFCWHSPTQAWCRNKSCRTNLWWNCMFSLCLQLNGPHRPYSQILPQNCLPQGWRWLVWSHGAIN